MADDFRNLGFLSSSVDLPFGGGPRWPSSTSTNVMIANPVGLPLHSNSSEFPFPKVPHPQLSNVQQAVRTSLPGSNATNTFMIPAVAARLAAPMDSQKNRQFQVQQDKLKHMSLPQGSKKMTPDELINTMLAATAVKNGKKPLPKLTSSMFHHPVAPLSASAHASGSDDFGDFGDFVAASHPVQAEPTAPLAPVITTKGMPGQSSQTSSTAPVNWSSSRAGEINGFAAPVLPQQPSGVLGAIFQGRAPSWLTNLELTPPFYRELAARICSSPMPGMFQPDPRKAFEIFASSGLPGPLLSQIWSAVHPIAADSFELPEFFAVLALVAIVQQLGNNTAVSIDMIMNLPVPPVPVLAASDATPAPSSIALQSKDEPPSPEFKIGFGFSPPVFEKVKFPLRKASDEDDDDFGDFQSVTTVTAAVQRPPSPPSLIAENDDKYAALRSLTFEDDEPPLMDTPLSSMSETPLDEPILLEPSVVLLETVFLEAPASNPIAIQATSARPDTPDTILSLPEVLSLDKLPPPKPVVIPGDEITIAPLVKSFSSNSNAFVSERYLRVDPVSAQTDDFGDFVAASGDTNEGTKEETRSVASLDFAASSNSNNVICAEGEGDSFWVVNPLDTESETAFPAPTPVEHSVGGSNDDKYSVFRGLTDEFGGATEKSKAVLTEFEKMWKCGTEAFRTALELVNEALKEDCIDEFLAVPNVSEFFYCVFEIFTVGVRCYSAFRENFGDSAMTDGKNSWETFSGAFRGFFDALKQSGSECAANANADVLETMALDSFCPEAPSSSKCGVCLTSAVAKSTPVSASTTPVTVGAPSNVILASNLSPEPEEFRLNAQTIQWGVSRYHVSCANLWLNRIHSVLPALTL